MENNEKKTAQCPVCGADTTIEEINEPWGKEMIERCTGLIETRSDGELMGCNWSAVIEASPDKGETATGEREQVCCRMLKDPDTKEYGDKIHSLCGWECMPLTPPKGIEVGKSLEECKNLIAEKYNHKIKSMYWDSVALDDLCELYASQQQGWTRTSQETPTIGRLIAIRRLLIPTHEFRYAITTFTTETDYFDEWLYLPTH